MSDTDDLTLLANTLVQIEFLLYTQDQAECGIGLNVDANKTVRVF